MTFVALAVVCFIAVGNAARLNSRTSSKTNATGLDEEYDEFVPYQGDRFDIFDWDLSKVYMINQQTFILLLYTRI